MATELTHDAAHESHGDHGCGCGPNHEAHAEPPKPQQASAELEQPKTNQVKW